MEKTRRNFVFLQNSPRLGNGSRFNAEPSTIDNWFLTPSQQQRSYQGDPVRIHIWASVVRISLTSSDILENVHHD